MSQIRRIMLVLFMCGVFPVLAQETMVLDLSQSVSVALENNPEIRMAEKEAAKAKAGIWEAWGMLMPSVDASASFQHAWDLQVNTIPNFIKEMVGPTFPGYDEMPDFVRFAFGLENTLRYGAMLTQPIFLGGAGIAGIQIAGAAHRASQHTLEAKRQTLIFRTADAFYACLLMRELVRVQEEALAQAQANLDVVHKRYDVGTASGFDKMRAEVEVANLKPELIAVRNNLQSALTGLRTVLGLPKETRIDVSGTLSFTPDEMGEMPLNDVLDQAYQNRPELFAMSAQKRMASGGVAVARSQFLPKVYFQTDYSYMGMRNDLKFARDDMFKGFTSSLSLSIPLFQGFRRIQQVQKARLDYKLTLDIEKQLSDGIAAEVEIAHNTFREAKEKYLSAEESIQLAEEALRLATLMYEEGASTQLDVLSSQLALNRARLNHASALYEYQKARYGLRRVTGLLKGVL